MALDRAAHPDAGVSHRDDSRGTAANLWARWGSYAVSAFFIFVGALLVRFAREVDWAMAWQSVRAYRPATLALAASLAAASYALYCTFDLIGRHQTGHALSVARVMGVSFVSYAFNLNLGSLVGGGATRYRLYSRLGLKLDVVTKVWALSLLTNWVGYLLLGGVVFALRLLQLPPDWRLDSGDLRLIGGAMLFGVAAYLWLCARGARREWKLRHWRFELPSCRVALLQLGLSTLNWLLIAAILFVLLRERIDYPAVLAVTLIAAVAGVISHIPAGLGVLEAVFLVFLSHRTAQGELLAALLAYRALYYIAPLSLATLLFFATGVGSTSRATDAGAPGTQAHGGSGLS